MLFRSPGDRLGDGRAGHHATTRASPRVASMFGDDHRRLGDLGELVPGRLGIAGRRLMGQGRAAGGAALGDVIDDRVDSLRRQATAEGARMAGLPAPLPPGPRLDDRPGGAQWIGRGRDRGIGGILIKPKPKFVNEGFQLGDPPQRGVKLATQPLALWATRRLGGLLITHKSGEYAMSSPQTRLTTDASLSRHWTVTIFFKVRNKTLGS